MRETDRRTIMAGIGAGLVVAAASGACAAPRDRKIGYAIVGLGGYAELIMSKFAECEHARLTALVSGTPEKLERFGARYQIPPTHRYSYATFDRIRDNPDVDVVYVILPNSMHAEYTVRAARAGKHVMCEKPMAVSAAECRTMIDACRAAGRKLMIGYRSRFEPHNRLAIQLAREGFVGPTRIVTSEHGFNAQPNQWRLDRALSGGGSLMDIGIYSLNAVRYLTGEEPVAVSAIESTDRSDPRFRTVEDRITFLLRFPSGIEATCVSSYSSNHNAYRVIGTKGRIELEPATGYDGHKMFVNRDGRTEPRAVAAGKGQHAGQLDHLAECILDDTQPLVPGEEGLADLRVIEAIYRSAREGRRVQLDA
ncbi:Gfo/Idh/MocA family oxidoreductase [Sphingomonas sp. PL-96]|uniref:Gfo/Idh/MocA family protein n=1 Tax=Sphingomonas sp. PL-96 TaxID=2887201 RepID=UPI001E4196E2|nr:Gfo/Idh/MocA family oxidoreductase [Sphingomonas sp. PL-96]MCC2976589.1 Gfo/Idh/MocA family oxidoreductase [Sphingomonas sp. PL-96]